MNQRSRIQMLAIVAGCLAMLGVPIRGAAQSTCATFGTVSIDGGAYIYQNNEWNSGAEQCATVSGTGFTLTTADFDLPTDGAPATYASLYRGCHWGDCTSSNPFPIEENNIASASTSVTITQPSGYNNDSAYDIWFNQTSTTSGQPNGTEIMIWINHQGSPQPFGSQTATETIDGATWEVWTGQQSSWKIVSYVRQTPVTSVSNLNLLPFFSDAVSRGSLEASWWLIDVEFGFEIWTGGQGLGASGFSVSAAAGSGGGGSKCAAAPSSPSGVKGTAASSSVINVSWTADTAPANCTISSYNVFRSQTSGFTASSSNQIASGITSTSYSDGGLAAGTTYYYRVEAVDADGTSPASAQGSAETSPASGGGSSCHVIYSITNQWPSGFGAAITIDNTGSTALSNWTLTWTFANGQTVTQLW
ncbi:MAG: cellulose binding domain-containing protein, partial [Acidobacteriaceae bacterium]